MTNRSDVANLLAEAAEKIRREAYAAGWRDAIAAASTALADLSSTESTAAVDAREAVEFSIPAQEPVANLTPGTTPYYTSLHNV